MSITTEPMDYYPVDEEEEFETLDDTGTPFREQLVFLIDTHSEMFKKLEDEQAEMFKKLKDEQGIQATSLFDLSLRVCNDVMRSRIIDSPKDEICVMFYGTKDKKNENGFENVFTFLDLDVTDVQRIKTIVSITDDSFNEAIGIHSDPEAVSADSLKFGLWAAGELLDNKLRTAKTILLFTANSDPCAKSSQTSDQILKRAEQLRDAGIMLRVFLLPSEVKTPSTSFWTNVNNNAKLSDELDDFDEDVLQRLKNLFGSVRKHERALASLNMTIIKDLECAVKLYLLVRPAKKGKVLKLDARTNEELVASTAYICNDTGAKLDRIEYFSFANQRTELNRYPSPVMKAKDVKRVKMEDENPGIRIFGFHSAYSLKDYHQICPSLFVYPNEVALKGSTTTFIALHETMLRSESIAICNYSETKSSQPRIAALLPQRETLDQDGLQVTPPGFHLIVLPFMDDMRYPERDPKIVGQTFHYAFEEEAAAAAAVVEAVTLPEDFSTIDISNPYLQRHYQALEALALNDELPDMSTVVDKSAPNAAFLQTHSDVIQAFKQSVYGELMDLDAPASGKKRKLIAEDTRTYVARIDWKELAEQEQLHTLTVEKLKCYLEFHNLPLGGKKAKLITRIKAHLAG